LCTWREEGPASSLGTNKTLLIYIMKTKGRTYHPSIPCPRLPSSQLADSARILCSPLSPSLSPFPFPSPSPFSSSPVLHLHRHPSALPPPPPPPPPASLSPYALLPVPWPVKPRNMPCV